MLCAASSLREDLLDHCGAASEDPDGSVQNSIRSVADDGGADAAPLESEDGAERFSAHSFGDRPGAISVENAH